MAFIARLDGLLTEQLGRKGIQSVQDSLDFAGIGVSDLRRFGLSLLLISAVAPSLPATAWWVSHFADYRLYFNVVDFTCSRDFPTADDIDRPGALQITDSSRPHGHVMQLDWLINLIPRERDLRQSKSQATMTTKSELSNSVRDGCVSAPPTQARISEGAIQATLANLRKASDHDAFKCSNVIDANRCC
jgi:hypothetical protein